MSLLTPTFFEKITCLGCGALYTLDRFVNVDGKQMCKSCYYKKVD